MVFHLVPEMASGCWNVCTSVIPIVTMGNYWHINIT
jgi:hypothetical protein